MVAWSVCCAHVCHKGKVGHRRAHSGGPSVRAQGTRETRQFWNPSCVVGSLQHSVMHPVQKNCSTHGIVIAQSAVLLWNAWKFTLVVHTPRGKRVKWGGRKGGNLKASLAGTLQSPTTTWLCNLLLKTGDAQSATTNIIDPLMSADQLLLHFVAAEINKTGRQAGPPAECKMVCSSFSLQALPCGQLNSQRPIPAEEGFLTCLCHLICQCSQEVLSSSSSNNMRYCALFFCFNATKIQHCKSTWTHRTN